MARGTKIMKKQSLKILKNALAMTIITCIFVSGHTYSEAPIQIKTLAEELYPGENIICDPLSLSVSCHIGPHSLAIAICKKI